MKRKSGIFILGAVFGIFLMLTTTLFAQTVRDYILNDAKYPIYVNGNQYQSETLPILNYQGSTYVPLRAVSELLGVKIDWDETLRQVDIFHDSEIQENAAFRNIDVTGSGGNYVINGEARTFEANVQYEVEDGHFLYVEGFTTASTGAPEWGTFTIRINIPSSDLPENATLMLILFETSAQDGSRINELPIVLETFAP